MVLRQQICWVLHVVHRRIKLWVDTRLFGKEHDADHACTIGATQTGVIGKWSSSSWQSHGCRTPLLFIPIRGVQKVRVGLSSSFIFFQSKEVQMFLIQTWKRNQENNFKKQYLRYVVCIRRDTSVMPSMLTITNDVIVSPLCDVSTSGIFHEKSPQHLLHGDHHMNHWAMIRPKLRGPASLFL